MRALRANYYAVVALCDHLLGQLLDYFDRHDLWRDTALVLASVPMGLLFAQQRRITGGIQASMLTHVVWSALMLRYLPPLFASQLAEERLPTPG